MNPRNLAWIVSQLGARQHYAVPRVLHRENCLDIFFTDAWCRAGCRLLRQGPPLVRAFANRTSAELPADKVKSWNLQAFWHALRQTKQKRNKDPAKIYQHHVHVGRTFANAVVDVLRRRPLDPERYVFFGFCTGSLEVLQYLKQSQIRTIVDQISAGPYHLEQVIAESEIWKGWEESRLVVHPEHEDRLRAEWETASLVLVNSEWSRKALIKQGVPTQKIIVVPIAFEGGSKAQRNLRPRGKTKRVLWAGSVSIAKGIQYLFQAAKILEKEDLHFVIAGGINLNRSIVANAPKNMEFLGQCPRDKMQTLYETADFFVFPTISDGFGITQIEAMSHGLPVIATPNCGEVVQHGQNGLVVPARDSAALVEAIRTLARDAELLESMSIGALKRVGDFSLAKYAENLFSSVAQAWSIHHNDKSL